MPWPWVSRELFNHVKQQLADCEKERLALLDHVLAEPQAQPVAAVETKAPEAKAKLATPFDTTLARFRKSTDKARFRARLNG